ncbi:MAG: alpha/beta hydrolase, partial [Endomicrobium sp.]|nr:alpha/beta hydrolase [Endomicrobium sp.]
MKRAKKLIILPAVLMIAAAISLFIFTPYPAVWIVKRLFSMTHYSVAKNYESMQDKVLIKRNINYKSLYPDGLLDLILPKTDKKDKIIFWVHGGGYIGDDKKKVEPYMIMLAANGYPVISINYALAPKYRYPAQIKQIEEAWTFIKGFFNDEKVYFGGDSAGAQLTAQFVNIQTNPQYAKDVNETFADIKINRVIDASRIGGVILFCGPYNLKEFLHPKKDTMKLPYKQIGWAYFGTRNINDKKIEYSNIINRVDADYPPVFITDGNTHSFEHQAKELEISLKAKGVYVKSVFYSKDEALLQHEYQFNMDTS